MILQSRQAIFTIMLLLVLSPLTAGTANFLSTKSGATQLNRLSITIADHLFNHILHPDYIREEHRTEGAVTSKLLDDGNELINANHLHVRVGPYEEYKLNGMFYIYPGEQGISIINRSNSILNFIVYGKDWVFDVQQFKATIQDLYENDTDFLLISYEMHYANDTTGNVRVKTTEPLKLKFEDGSHNIGSAKPVSGKLEITQNGTVASVTILPTPENYTYSILNIESGNQSFRDEWRYLHQEALRTFPGK